MEKELRELKRLIPATSNKTFSHEFNTYIRLSEQIKNFPLPQPSIFVKIKSVKLSPRKNVKFGAKPRA